MNYEELVKDLRDIEKTMFALGTSPINMDNVSIRLAYDKRWGRTAADAADAIEALSNLVSLNTERCEGLREQLRKAQEQYEKHLNELEQQLPKRGEWIKHPEVKNIYGGVYIECPFCGEKYVVQNVSDEKFCRNCGSDLRAKMEVQE